MTKALTFFLFHYFLKCILVCVYNTSNPNICSTKPKQSALLTLL